MVLLLEICVALSCNAQHPVTGRWEGEADCRGAKLHILLDVSAEANGLRATVGAPDDFVSDILVTTIRYAAPNIHLEKQAGDRLIVFDGTLSGNAMTGTMSAGEITAAIRLVRVGDVPSAPYQQQEVQFQNGDQVLHGTLFASSKEQRPAIVVIHSSHQPDRQDLRPIANLFARQGIATLIYDKRDLGADQTQPHRYSLRDLAGDALAAVQFLKSRAEINPSQIGILGISEGGWVAPIAASQSKDIAFVITISAPVTSWAETNLYANETSLRAGGFSAEELREALAALRSEDAYVRNHDSDAEALQLLLDHSQQQRWASATNLDVRVPSAADISSWVRWRDLDLDPTKYWERVTAPVLAIYGDLDDRTPVKTSVARLEHALKQAGNKDVKIAVFPGAGHEITLPAGQRPDTKGKWDWPRLAPGYLQTLMDWTLKRAVVPPVSRDKK